MKRSAVILGAIAAFAAACANSQQMAPVADDEIGLSKTSVLEDPAPAAFDYTQADPSQAKPLPPRSYGDAPPQIPHRVDMFVPVTMKMNQCINCHDQPTMIGKKAKGMPTPMPASHYVTAEGKMARNNAQHVCTQCHAPQADVSLLVESTFGMK
jgi:nitrate reductase (cytochrome), electron transfer subunit